MPPRALWAAYVFINGCMSVGLLAALSVVFRVPFIWPSVAPTAYELFFRPRSEASTPHNTILGHLIGIVCGYGFFLLLHAPGPTSLQKTNFDWRTVAAATLAMGFTAALMILLNASHPPAGSTTLIVALGLVVRPAYLGILELAVVLLAAQAFCVNRLAGLPYPVWKTRRQ